MKKTGNQNSEPVSKDDLRSEYRFDYGKARSNRFVGHLDDKQVVVMLDPDISKVFTSSRDVNAVLRALIETMPHRTNQAGEDRPLE